MSNELISVEGTELSIKEYNGQRVVTFKDIDTVHQRPEGTAYRNFRSNKKYFIEGEDYIKISADEIRRCKIMEISTRARADITFITESGYLLLAKSFTDELSWQVQRSLVNAYFKQKEQATKNEACLVKNSKSWFERNNWKMKLICECFDWERKYLYHKILSELSDIYNLDVIEDMYIKSKGRIPRYKTDLLDYYPPLRDMAERYIDYLLAETED